MLDNTHDPIADFINAAASDTVAFCAVLTYEEFLQRTSQMNEIATFKQLQTRSQNIGYKILKVVFRGFHSSDSLQQMHDQAIQVRWKRDQVHSNRNVKKNLFSVDSSGV